MSPPDSRRSALFFAVSFLQALDNQLIPVLLPDLKAEMGAGPEGLLLTAYAVACGITPFIATANARRDRVKGLALIALLALGAAAVAFASTTAFPARVALRAVAGGSSGILSMTLLLAAARVEDPALRARQFTVISAGYLSAVALGLPIGTYAVKHFGVGPLYVAIGCIAAALATVFAMVIGRAPDPDSATRRNSILRLLKRREAGLVLLATGLVGVAMAGPVGFLSSFLAKVHGLGIEDRGMVYMWAGIGPLLAMPLQGTAISKWKPHRVAIAGSLVIAVPLFLFPTLATSLATAASVMLFCFFIETFRRAALQGSLADCVSEEDLPRYVALRGAFIQFGLAAGAAIAQVQFSAWGFAPVCWTAAALSVAAAAILVAAATRAQPSATPGS